ncbi:Sporulation kinase E [Fundidesulfovibrio magnetotacticus]|uniref:histidine kinase n=1 Tax=Fundidesulfovibrio magnetotacticus TaxID=2730080 RepID=A0A6V8LW80_9BACT|nr:transporter substrate-binding domain-containing protein [Fundidesulfovibrio magnetotacticus]GFK94319.1 Sporulation kinase E [Fundidesulfovibrio magnetotacticus]
MAFPGRGPRILATVMALCAAILALNAPAVSRAAEPPSLALTSEERAFLHEHPVLRMGVGVAFPPFQFVEKEAETRAFRGVAADTVKLLEARLGVRMEPVWDITFAEALQMGKTGGIDLYPCLSRTVERAEYLAFTAPYLSYPLVIVSRAYGPFIGAVEDLQGRKVAEVEALATISKVRNEYPGLALDYVFVADASAMLEAVSFGRAEACIVDLAVASYLINELGLTNLKVAAPTRWGDNPLSMAVPKDRAILAGILQKALASLTFEETDAIRQRWMGLGYSSLVSPVLFRRILWQGGGAVVLVVGVILWWNRRLHREVEVRTRAEEALRASEERMRSVVESSPMGMHFFKLEDDGRLVLTAANPAADDLLGIEHAKLLGLGIEEAFPGVAGTPVPEMYRQVARGETGMRSFEMPYKDRSIDGTFAVYVFRTGEGAATTLFADVSERRRMQDLMIQTEKMMSVGGLAAGMAHEINNPLGGMLLGVQVLKRRLTSDLPANEKVAAQAGCTFEDVRRYMERRDILPTLEAIREAGVRAAQIVSSMLEFSRKDAAGFAPARMEHLLDKTVDLCSSDYNLRRKHDFKSIRILREYDPVLPPLPCLENQLQQVFLNLLTNAAQAMAQTPSPTLTLRTAREEDRARIEIEDNGPGITQEVRKRLFEPFFTTKPVGMGTGLGLSVSYFIVVHHHGGTIDVESAPGAGTRFIIRLPLEQARADAA